VELGPGRRQEFPIVTPLKEFQLENTQILSGKALAVVFELYGWLAKAGASRPHDELDKAMIVISAAFVVLRCESLVIVIVSRKHDGDAMIVQ
jgi:hypothetical protein